MKQLTRDQVESRKAKAVRFVRDVLKDEARAEEIEAESLEDYAARKRMEINPARENCEKEKFRRNATMARKRTIEDLEDEIESLRTENDELHETVQDLEDRLSEIVDVAEGEEEEEESEGE
ncbi:MAG: hypothetical protein AB1898_09525 [Acidobacteriota bacterium]